VNNYPRDDYEEESSESCPVCDQPLNDDGDCENPNCSQFVPDYSWIADDREDWMDEEGREIIEDDELDDEDEFEDEDEE
jgi:hypothetical protein